MADSKTHQSFGLLESPCCRRVWNLQPFDLQLRNAAWKVLLDQIKNFDLPSAASSRLSQQDF